MVEGSEQGSEVKVGFKSVLVSLPGYPVLVTNNLKKNHDAHRRKASPTLSKEQGELSNPSPPKSFANSWEKSRKNRLLMKSIQIFASSLKDPFPS